MIYLRQGGGTMCAALKALRSEAGELLDREATIMK